MKVKIERIDRGDTAKPLLQVCKTRKNKWWERGDNWVEVELFSIGIGQTEEEVLGHAKKYADQLLIPPTPPKPLKMPEIVYINEVIY